jgi:hypothetical protein
MHPGPTAIQKSDLEADPGGDQEGRLVGMRYQMMGNQCGGGSHAGVSSVKQ